MSTTAPILLLQILCERFFTEKLDSPVSSAVERIVATARAAGETEICLRPLPVLDGICTQSNYCKNKYASDVRGNLHCRIVPTMRRDGF